MLNASCIIKHFVFRNTLCVKLVCKQFHTSKRSYILSKIEVIWKMTIFWLFFSQKSQIFEFGCANRRPLRSNLIQTTPITYASFETHPLLKSWKLKKKTTNKQKMSILVKNCQLWPTEDKVEVMLYFAIKWILRHNFWHRPVIGIPKFTEFEPPTHTPTVLVLCPHIILLLFVILWLAFL